MHHMYQVTFYRPEFGDIDAVRPAATFEDGVALVRAHFPMEQGPYQIHAANTGKTRQLYLNRNGITLATVFPSTHAQPASAEVIEACKVLAETRNDMALGALFNSPPRLEGPARQPTAPMTTRDVNMQDIVGDYDTPDQVPEWQWVERNASYGHRDNGKAGVWEFMLNLSRSFEDNPGRLQQTIDDARRAGVSYLLVHQGT